MTASSPTLHQTTQLAAGIIVAGGMSQRMGHDKAALTLDGVNLLRRAIDAIAAPVVVVGHPELAELVGECVICPLDAALPSDFFHHIPAGAQPVALTREDPPLGGPAAGLVTGITQLAALGADALIQLAPVDMPHLDRLMPLLDAADWPDSAALVPVDEGGRLQLPAGRYRLGALRQAAAELGDPQGASVFGLLGGIERQEISLPDFALRDVDDPTQAKAAGLSFKMSEPESENDGMNS